MNAPNVIKVGDHYYNVDQIVHVRVFAERVHVYTTIDTDSGPIASLSEPERSEFITRYREAIGFDESL